MALKKGSLYTLKVEISYSSGPAVCGYLCVPNLACRASLWAPTWTGLGSQKSPVLCAAHAIQAPCDKHTGLGPTHWMIWLHKMDLTCGPHVTPD